MNLISAPARTILARILRLTIVIALFNAFLATVTGYCAQSTVIGWGWNQNGQTRAPLGLTTAVSVSAGSGASAALRADGTIVEWGFPLDPPMPAGLSGIMTFACGHRHTLAVRSNGTVITWGESVSGQDYVLPGLSNVISVAGGAGHSLALRGDGTVVAWGNNSLGQSAVPPGLSNVIAVAAGGNNFSAYSVALKSDGTIVAWGDNRQLQTTIPPGLSNVVAIATSPLVHSLALKSDGTVAAWGVGRLATNVPRALSNVVAISAGSGYSVAVRADGSVVAWGENPDGAATVPAAARNVSAIASGWFHNIAVTHPNRPPWPRIVEQPVSQRGLVGRAIDFSVTATSAAPVSFQWQFRGRKIPGATDRALRLENLSLSAAGDYAVVVSAGGLSVRSAPAFLALTDPPVAVNATARGREDTELFITLSGHDPSGLPSTAMILSRPMVGRLHQFDSGRPGEPIDLVSAVVTDPQWRLVYVPPPDGNGFSFDRFQFAVSNELGDSDPAQISIELEPINDPPGFVAGTNLEVLEDAGPQVVSGWASHLRAGPLNEASQSLMFLIETANPAIFSVWPHIDTNGTLRYTPAPNANGSATVTVRLQDNGGTDSGGRDRSEPHYLNISITAVNDQPIARPATLTVHEDASVEAMLGASDTDGDNLTYVVSPPAHGTLSGTPPALQYRPARDFHGTDRFTFVVHDGQVISSPATVEITVLPLNDPPTASARAFSPTAVSSNELNHLVCVAVNNATAVVILDGSLSDDVESDELRFIWYEAGRMDPLARGVMATNLFTLGRHEILLHVSDGRATMTTPVPLLIDVVTPGEVVEQILLELANGDSRINRRPIVASLKSAIGSFDRGNITAGLHQLQAGQNKIRVQLGPTEPSLADVLIVAIETLRTVLTD